MAGVTSLWTAAPALGAVPASTPFGPVHQARATSDPAPASGVIITALSPAAPKASDTVRLGGTVRNRSGSAVTDVTVQLVVVRQELLGSDAVTAAATGTLPATSRTPDATAEVGDLAEGAGASFRLSFRPDKLGLDANSWVDAGVWGVQVTTTGRTEDGSTVSLGTASFPLAVGMAALDSAPVKVALTWPVSAPPSILPDGSTAPGSSDPLAPTATPTRLVDIARGEPVTWVIDPDLVTTATTRAAQASDDKPDADAAAFLEALPQAIASDSEVWSYPAARPDIPAITGSGARAAGFRSSASWATDIQRRAVAASAVVRTVVGRPTRTLVDIRDWTVTDATAAAVSASSPNLVVFPGAPGGSAAALANPGRWLTPTPGPTRAVSLSGAGVTDAIAVRQALLAQVALIGLNTPDYAVVIDPPASWAPSNDVADAVLDTWANTKWIRETTVGEVLAKGSAVPPNRWDTTTPQQSPTIGRDLVTSASSLRAGVERIARAMDEPTGLRTRFVQGEARSLSEAWRTDTTAGASYGDAAAAQARALRGRLFVATANGVTLSSRTGSVPLTVVNETESPVQVRVHFAPANRDRLQLPDTDLLRLEVGEKATIRAAATATANGTIPVEISLITADGMTVGTPTRTQITATNFGVYGWVMIIGGTGLMVVALARRSRRGRARAGQHDVQEET